MNRDSPGCFEYCWGTCLAACSRSVLLAQYKYVRCGVNGRGAAEIWTALQSCMSNLLNGLCIHPWSLSGGHKGSHQARVRVRDNHFHFLKTFLSALQACHSLNVTLSTQKSCVLSGRCHWANPCQLILFSPHVVERLWVCLSQTLSVLVPDQHTSQLLTVKHRWRC